MSAERAVQLAVMAAGRLDDDWEQRVHRLVPMVAALLRPAPDGSRISTAMRVAQQVLDADVIFGDFIASHLEESSQRLVVTLQADNAEEPEEMRTHRIDEPGGQAMSVRLVGLKPGERCAFFKVVDQIAPRKGARLLVNIERQPNKTPRETPPVHQRARGKGAERPADASPAEAPAPNLSRGAVLRGLLAELGEEHRLRAISLLAKHGWTSADDLKDANDDAFERALYIIRYQRDDWF